MTNDRFDPLRPGSSAWEDALVASARSGKASRGRFAIGVGKGMARRSIRRPGPAINEGRWSRLPDPEGDSEASCLAWAATLIERYGVLARDRRTRAVGALVARSAPWLARSELRGELRRGYFVEGLSGVQYASAEAADTLAHRASESKSDETLVLISTLDPANLYGSGALFDVPLLDGGRARLSRTLTSYLVVSGGRPVLIIEAGGKRLTGLASASEIELRQALSLLTGLAGPGRRALKVDSYNGLPTLNSPAAAWLAELGFVRDYPGMTYYAGY